MNISYLIENLIEELSIRSKEGIPNLQNREHIWILSEILTEWGLSEIKHDLIENLLTEKGSVSTSAAEKAKKMGLKNIAFNYYSKTGEKPATHKAEEDQIVTVKPGEFEKDAAEISGEEPKPEKGVGDGEGGEGGKEGEDQQPQQNVKGFDSFDHAPDNYTHIGDGKYKIKGKEDDESSPIFTKDDSGKYIPTKSDKEKPEFNDSLDDSISELREKRRKGIAGAGGVAASYGESVYSDNVTSLDLNEFQKENEKEIQKEVENLKKKKLNKEQQLVLKNMGYSTSPPDEEGLRYLAARKVFYNQQLEKAKAEKDHVYNQDPKFRSSFESWMNAAFDGAVATRELLEEGDEIDTSRPYKCVQSDPSVDKKVLAELERRRDNAKSDEEREHYEREIYFFKKSGTYHDTYVVGEDSKGRMTIVSVTNKANSSLKDPHNNTTPAARLAVLEGKYDEKTQKLVVGVIKEGIDRVTNVTEDTKNNSAKIEVDENFAKLARIAAPTYFKTIDDKAKKPTRIKDKKNDRFGLPRAGFEFGCWLEDKGISGEDYNNLDDTQRIKLVQQFMGDAEWHEENQTGGPTYDPFAKLFIKVGEVDTGGHNELLKVRTEAEKQGIDLNASNIKEAGGIKRNEQDAVKETHENVVNTIYDSDKEKGFPKTDSNGNVVENGPAAQAYIDTVLDALHFNSYIDFSDKDDNKLIAQMGIRGAKPSDVRNCLADLSGYGDIPPGNREGLKEHLKNTSTIDAETGAIVIKSKKNGRETQLAEDTWRTAGTSQKVASSFGTDMQDCIASKVDERRSRKNQ